MESERVEETSENPETDCQKIHEKSGPQAAFSFPEE